jgi:O-acetyl-ADP-ribose deacetylase (regulator of RNase III)
VTTSFGPRVREYEVWGRLGEGGMSEVWLAKHVLLSVPVIIKTLRALATRSTTSGLDLMLREARHMARIASPRVVRATDAGVHEGIPYLVEEYVDGIDLAELDRRRRKAIGLGLPLWFVAYAMSETCHALHAAHQAGVIHRDVKPSNLFGHPEVGVRLGDFGLAVTHTDAGAREISGTLKFMAPEQLRCDSVDRYTDVYGAGATACDLRYGETPFKSVDAILDRSLRPRFPVPATPAEAYFQHLVGWMMDKDTFRRPQDALEPARHFSALARALRPHSLHAGVTCVGPTEFVVGGCGVALAVGDIATARVDAIVSSSNYEMKMRSGVALALRTAGGDAIEAEAMKDGEQPLGTCIVTGAGRLHARHVLHAVSAWNEASCVGRAVHRALLLADELGAHVLALPALGTGAARVSLETCAHSMTNAIRWHLALGGSSLSRVTIYLEDEAKLRIFRAVVDEALRGEGEALGGGDLGLPDVGGEVRADAATMLDAASLLTDPPKARPAQG